MKKEVNNFYEENRPSFEIAAVLLILSGVILNLNTPEGIAGNALKFVQFIFLFSSTIAIFFLIRDAIGHFMTPLLKEVAEKMENGSPKNQPTSSAEFEITLTLAMRRFGLAIILIFISLLVLVSLIAYILFIYPYQAAFIAVTIVCYLIFINLFRLIKSIITIKNNTARKSGIIFISLLYSLLLLGIPFSAYIFLFSGLSFTPENLAMGLLSSLIASGVILMIFILTRKKKL